MNIAPYQDVDEAFVAVVDDEVVGALAYGSPYHEQWYGGWDRECAIWNY